MLLNFNRFVLGSQTPGAKFKPEGLTADIESHRMDVRLPVTAGMPLGMAYIMTELWSFTT